MRSRPGSNGFGANAGQEGRRNVVACIRSAVCTYPARRETHTISRGTASALATNVHRLG
jgi:hypothetical protein